MAYNAEYAVRIAKVKMSTRKNPDCIYITFGPKAHVKKKYNAVEVSVFPGKLSFRFFTTEVKKFGSKSNTAISKKIKITDVNSSTSIKRIAIYDEDFIKKIEGFEGEYQDASVNPKYNLISVDDYVCWINLCNKESYTNMYKNTSTEYSHKQPEHEDKTDICLEKLPKVVTPEDVKHFIDKQEEDKLVVDSIKYKYIQPTDKCPHGGWVEDHDEPVKLPVNDIPREKVRELFRDLSAQARKCTDTIQSAMADIFNYQLRNVHVTYEEGNRNIKLQQILLKYIKLQDEIEEIAGYDDYKPKEGDGNVQS